MLLFQNPENMFQVLVGQNSTSVPPSMSMVNFTNTSSEQPGDPVIGQTAKLSRFFTAVFHREKWGQLTWKDGL